MSINVLFLRFQFLCGVLVWLMKFTASVHEFRDCGHIPICDVRAGVASSCRINHICFGIADLDGA